MEIPLNLSLGQSNMASLNSKFHYLLRKIRESSDGGRFNCPSCGAVKSQTVARKYLVTTLRRCRSCLLLFRAPTDVPAAQEEFYQDEYSEGFTTDMPDSRQLKALLETKFQGTEKDYQKYIEVLRALRLSNGLRVLDFGCSWGYGSWQLKSAGYDVDSYEISLPRAEYARKELGLTVYTSLEHVKDEYDVCFMSHVLEHVPSVNSVIDFVMRHLKSKGLLVCFTPNGSDEFRRVNGDSWRKLWGMVHPNFLDKIFYENRFRSCRYVICSDPFDLDLLNKFADQKVERAMGHLSGSELLLVVKK